MVGVELKYLGIKFNYSLQKALINLSTTHHCLQTLEITDCVIVLG